MKQEFLNRNEIIQGPAPKCSAALRSFDREHMYRYFDGYYASLLVPRLAKAFNIPESRIIATYGSEYFLRTVFDWLRPEKDNVLVHKFHYTFFPKYLAVKGIPLHLFEMREKETGFAFDVDDCIEKYRQHHPRLILINSPNNPTGNSITSEDLARMLREVDKGTLVVLDEAYWGFNPAYENQKFLQLIEEHPNLCLLRTFSKLYALAGLRIGYALCGDEVKNMLRYDPHYLGMSRVLEQVAIAALDSKGYYATLSKTIVRDREWLKKNISKLKHFSALDSHANFIAVKAKGPVIPLLKEALPREKVLIAKFVADDLLRVSITPRKYLAQFLALLNRIERAV